MMLIKQNSLPKKLLKKIIKTYKESVLSCSIEDKTLVLKNLPGLILKFRFQEFAV